MVKYLESYQILLNSQHGFRKGHSCITKMLTILETVTKCLDDGKNIDIIFLDFAKALIRKLECHVVLSEN